MPEPIEAATADTPKVPIKGRFVQFPLCSLAYGSDWRQRLFGIANHAAMHFGRHLLSERGAQERREMLSRTKSEPGTPADLDAANERHLALATAYAAFGWRLGNVVLAIEHCDRLDRFRVEFESKNGADMQVRIPKHVLEEAIYKAGDQSSAAVFLREFCVLSAVYATMGNSKIVEIRRAVIVRRALGYKSERVFRSEFLNRTDGAIPLKVHELRYVLEILEQAKFFMTQTLKCRFTWYARGITEQKFMERLQQELLQVDLRAARARRAAALAENELTPDLTWLAARVNAIMGRPPGQTFTSRELDALKEAQLTDTSNEEFQMLEQYYQAHIDRERRRQTVQTLLNNWPGEIDRARRWHDQHHPQHDEEVAF